MNKDLTAGSAVIALGLLYGGHAWTTLPLGTVRQMGPGMFPLGLGLLMAVIGLAIALPALGSQSPRPALPLRGMVCALAAVAAFALLIRPAGLFPATVATACLSSFAMPAASWTLMAGLSLALCGLTWALFIAVLHVSVPLAVWPF